MTAITSKTFTYGPATFNIPRGARVGAEMFLAAGRLLASLFSHRPKPSSEMTFEEVRELALSVQASDPGFSADLLAALARHEGSQS
jgi:hypothetical protein